MKWCSFDDRLSLCGFIYPGYNFQLVSIASGALPFKVNITETNRICINESFVFDDQFP